MERNVADRGQNSRDSLQHRLIFMLSFAICLFAGLGVGLFPGLRRGRRNSSLLAQARVASDTIAQLAFAG